MAAAAPAVVKRKQQQEDDVDTVTCGICLEAFDQDAASFCECEAAEHPEGTFGEVYCAACSHECEICGSNVCGECMFTDKSHTRMCLTCLAPLLVEWEEWRSNRTVRPHRYARDALKKWNLPRPEKAAEDSTKPPPTPHTLLVGSCTPERPSKKQK
jgi:hypothetical protein